MPERPRPDIDHTRDAMRRHDERVAEEPEPEPAEAEDEAGADEDEAGEDEDA